MLEKLAPSALYAGDIDDTIASHLNDGMDEMLEEIVGGGLNDDLKASSIIDEESERFEGCFLAAGKNLKQIGFTLENDIAIAPKPEVVTP